MSAEEDIHELVAAAESADETALEGWFAEDVTQIGSDVSYDREQVIGSIQALDDALADIEYTVREVWEGAETHAVHLEVSGTFDGTYRIPDSETGEEMTFEPTGERVEGSAVYVLGFDADGRVDRMASYGYTEMMMEMGVIGFQPERADAADSETTTDAAAETAED